MVFLDFWFAIFLPIALLGTWLAPKAWRPFALLALCLIFHWHYAGPAGMRPILILGVAVYLALRTDRMFFGVGGLCAAAWLFYRQPAVHGALGFPQGIAIPLAISFFTFEFVHLLVDRATGRLAEVPRPRDYFLFLLFFPSLASGPIKRIQQFQAQIPAIGWPGAEVAAKALARVAYGFFLKLVVSSWFYSMLPRDLISGPYDSTLLLGLYSYGYVALDLTAYSHIAIGIAMMMGVVLPENVRPVILARSFSDYWSRWHMSVTQWFRDYVLWPVAGPGNAVWRFYLGVALALFLSAFWHGTGVNILLWGAINAAAVVAETAGRRTAIWRRLSESRVRGVIPWVQWPAFQIFLMIQSVLFLYPIDQFTAQLMGSGVR